MEGNFQWFLDNYYQIYSLCGECYVAIKDKKIIQIFVDEHEACNWIIGNNLLGQVSIQYCNGDESGYSSLNFTQIAM